MAADVQSALQDHSSFHLQRKEGGNQDVPVVINLMKSPKLNTRYFVGCHEEHIRTFHIQL